MVSIFFDHELEWATQVALVIKSLPADADVWDMGSVPELGGFPGGGNGNPLQYSCLENRMDRAAWRATVQGVAKSWTQLKQLSTHDLAWGTCFNHNLYMYTNTHTLLSKTFMKQYLSLLWTMQVHTLNPKFHPKSKSIEMISQPLISYNPFQTLH